MRSRTRATTVVTGFAGLALAAGVLAGCAGDGDGEGADRGSADGGSTAVTDDGGATTEEVPPAGGVPGGAVLDDSLAVSQDGSQVLADCWSGICRWDTADGRLARVDDGSHVAISPDWSLLAGVGDDAEVLLVDAATREVVHELPGHDDEEVLDGSPVHDVAFSPDGSLVASSGLDRRVLVWSVDDGSEVAAFDTDDDVFALAFSPDGSRLAAAGGGPAQVYDVLSGEPVGSLPESGSGGGLAWSPDGRWLAGRAADGAPTVWSAEDLTPVDRLDGVRLEQLAFAPDSGSLAVTAADDTTVRLWAPEATGGDGRVRELAGHTDPPGAVAFGPDGRTLYSVGADGVRAWNATTARPASAFELPDR